MLYLLEKKVIQSFRVLFSLSSRSCQFELTSSGLVEVFPRALDASLPAKTTEDDQYTNRVLRDELGMEDVPWYEPPGW